jgi:cytochrome c1
VSAQPSHGTAPLLCSARAQAREAASCPAAMVQRAAWSLTYYAASVASSTGSQVSSLQNYGYSSAMKGADFVWDKEKLDRFIATPDEVVPGNNMKPYGGLTSAEDRAKVIVFLESLTTN